MALPLRDRWGIHRGAPFPRHAWGALGVFGSLSLARGQENLPTSPMSRLEIDQLTQRQLADPRQPEQLGRLLSRKR